MEKVIQKAKEGGYDIGDIYNRENVLMNPKFWQALGKAEVWEDAPVCKEDGFRVCYDPNHRAVYQTEWEYHWHRFIDHLAKGGTADDFFNNLIK